MPVIKINRLIVIKVAALIIAGLFIVWFVGWKSIRFDKNDKEIGRKVVFTVPMVIIYDIPANIAGEYIAGTYKDMLTAEESWENISPFFPNIVTFKVECDQVFNVDKVFYGERHGLLKKTWAPDLKYYVLSSFKYNSLVIPGGDYEEYSSDVANLDSGCAPSAE